MLYFDQLDEEKMGTIRQQFWAILHYPLHMAILLTVEGNTALVVWNSAVQALNTIWTLRPNDDIPLANITTVSDYAAYLNTSMWTIRNTFKSYDLAAEYKWDTNLTSIIDLTKNYTFKSIEFNEAQAPIVDKMFDYATNFVFKAHDATMYKMVAAMPEPGVHNALNAVYEVFDIVTLYFYVAAGATLLLLSTMYYFGKRNRSKMELGGPIICLIIGFILILIGFLGVYINKSTSGFKFRASNWLIPTVTIAFLVVVACDTLFSYLSDHTLHTRRHRNVFSHSQKNSNSTQYSPFFDDKTPMPPNDPLVENTTRSTHPQPSEPYIDDDTQPILQAPPPAPAAGTGASLPVAAAMAERFKPSTQQPSRSRFKSLRTQGWYSPVQYNEDDSSGEAEEGSEYGDEGGNEVEREMAVLGEGRL